MSDVDEKPIDLLKGGHSLPEMVAAASAASVAIAGVYYWGFFAKISGSLASTLSIPDLLIGGLIGMVPSFAAFAFGSVLRPVADAAGMTTKLQKEQTGWSGLVFPEKLIPVFWFSLLPYHLVRNSRASLAVVILVAGSMASIFLVSTIAWPSASLVFFLVLGVCMGWVSVAAAYDIGRWAMMFLMALSLGACSYTLGRASYAFQVSDVRTYHKDAVTLENGTVFFGKVILFTSQAVFLAGGPDYVQYFPLSNVKFVKRSVAE